MDGSERNSKGAVAALPEIGLDAFLAGGVAALRPGPAALIFAEDQVELAGTIAHHHRIGFAPIIVFAAESCRLPADALLPEGLQAVRADIYTPGAVARIVNRVIAAAPDVWFYLGYNAEYFFFPFCESRSATEMIAFHAQERRAAMLSHVIDLYARDLTRNPDGVSRDDAMFDRSGYYALARTDPANHNHPKERQLDIFGGLRWRFDEHVPPDRRRIDRIALFQARRGLEMRDDFTFNVEEYNTYSCPWHRNLTAAVASFRTAKALRRNPGSRFDIDGFAWSGSEPFCWNSRQLLELGMMESGQWF